MRPLDGYRVLDFTRALAGPYCTSLLADLGADVIKVEEPDVGDEARHWGPPFVGGSVGEGGERKTGESAYFLSMNRSKRSIALNLKAPEALEMCGRLAESSDVVIENFRPGVADRLGVGFGAVKARRPDVVYCS
ncbi:MAG TPA: CoA transferase, partial [Chloroflexota bacterium]|nr:CoA transferase [Chloroflexota bacterium]